MIFAVEKFKSLVVMVSKLHDHRKTKRTSTESFPRRCSCILRLELSKFLLAEEYLKQNGFCLQHLKKSVVIFFGRAKFLKASVILFKKVRKFFAQKVKPKFFFSKMNKKMIRFYFRSLPYTTFKANAKSFQNTTLGL